MTMSAGALAQTNKTSGSHVGLNPLTCSGPNSDYLHSLQRSQQSSAERAIAGETPHALAALAKPPSKTLNMSAHEFFLISHTSPTEDGLENMICCSVHSEKLFVKFSRPIPLVLSQSRAIRSLASRVLSQSRATRSLVSQRLANEWQDDN